MSASAGFTGRELGVAAALALLLGCETVPSDKLDLDAVLTERGACGDALFYAISDGDAAVLAVRSPGLLAAVEGDEPMTVGWTLPDEGVEVEAYFGSRVGASICDGGPASALVEHAYVATAGEATATVAPDGAGTVELAEVVLTHVEGRGDPLMVPLMTITGTLSAE